MTSKTKPIEVKGLAPMLSVFNMPSSIRFYRDLLGFDLVENSGPTDREDNYDWALLRLNKTELMLERRSGKCCQPAGDATALLNRHDMAIYFSCSDLNEIYRYLKEKDIDIEEPSVTDHGFKALYLRDPDGFPLVFHSLS